MHLPISTMRSFYDKRWLKLIRIIPGIVFSLCLAASLVAQTTDPVVTDQEYNTAIKKGDQYFTETKYDRALYEFETARKLKPGEKYPQEKIRAINEILDDQKTKNILFEVAVTSAEKWYKAADYKRAKAEFENALRIDPSAQYPKDRLAQINKIWSDPEVDALYAAAILRADDLFALKSYVNARAEYMVASDLKPFEQYPLDRIIAINEILANLQLQQDQYNSIIAKADQQFDKREYSPARSSYQDASNIKPDEAYPINRIKEIDILLEKLKAEREAYDRIIALADEYYLNKEFEKAKIEYEKAVGMKPSEAYAKNMIAKIDPQIAEMQRIQGEYDLAMTNASTLMQKKDYEGARSAFQKAGTLKPKEALPKDKIAEIDRILSDLAVQNENEQRYAASISRADSLFATGDLASARSLYQQSLTLKPSESYPRQKMDEIDKVFAELKSKEDAYAQAIRDGNSLIAAGDYAGARTAFQKASGLKPGENYPKTKVTEIDRILAERERIQKDYDAIITMADQFFFAGDYPKAMPEYQKAKNLKPQETYPAEQISEINRILQEKKDLETSYTSHIAAGDEFLKKKDYLNALPEYQKASSLKPSENYPKTRISEIEGMLAGIAANEKAYQMAVNAGDSLFTATSYELAIAEYQNALKLKPGEAYPQQKVEEIIRIQTDIKASEEAYQKAIAQGDKLFTAQSFQNARDSYVQATEIKPGEAYPRQRIAEIDGLLADLQSKEEAYAQAIREGDSELAAKTYENARASYMKASGIKPDEAYPKTKIAEIDKILAEIARIQQEYDKAIAAADAYYDKSDLSNARLKYIVASDLKPAEQYPRDRISLIDKTLADMEALEKGYRDAITQADDFFAKKDYPSAKVAYQQALGLKPSEKHPADRIAEIDRILAGIAVSELAYQEAVKAADALFAEKNYPSAILEYQKAQKSKPEETYPGEQIAKINQILADIKATEEGYKNAIAEADKLFLSKQYEDALVSYRKAMEIKPGETYPQTRIDEINTLLSDLKALEDSFAQAIEEGDRLLAATDYTGARTSYQKASGIKPAETYPKTKIAEIGKLLAEIARIQKEYELAVGNGDRYLTSKEYAKSLAEYQKAQGLKPQETYPPEQIAKINQIMEEIKNLEDAYALHIASGDELLAKREYPGALIEFQQASALKPGEIYPKTRISETEAALAAIQTRQKAYDEAVAKADGLFNSKEYDKAKLAYQEALTHDPGQTYPQDQIGRINGIVKDLEIQKSYDEAVAKADQFFETNDYDNARTEYQKALNLKPSESYPPKRIEEINSILAANEQARLESYTKAIEAGDSYVALQDYRSAKVQYQNAISIDPGQQYPKDRLREVEKILLDREMELKKAYQDAVAKADNLYTQKILDEAIDAYMAAHEIKNDEVYPLNMINQIKKYIADHAIVDILNTPVTISNNTEKKFDFNPVDIRQRKNNYVVMKARVLSETKPKVYLNYGKDATRSGGIVLKSIKDNKLNDYIIRVSAQDPWYRIDNGWLKLYSEGGDIEVTYIQISTAD